jgi:hypothetical protein
LDNPDVEAKLQEYFSKNPEEEEEAAAAAAAAATERADAQQQADSAPVVTAAAAKTFQQQVLDGAPEAAASPLCCHGTAAGGIDIVAACVAETAASADAGQDVAVVPADKAANDACAARTRAERDNVPCAHTMQQLLVARSSSSSGSNSSSAACTISALNALFSRAGSETCSSGHPVAADNLTVADLVPSSGSMLLLGLLPYAATNSAIHPTSAPGVSTAPPLKPEVVLPDQLANLHAAAAAIDSPGSLLGALSLDAFGLTPADSMKPSQDLPSRFADLEQLPDAPHLQLGYDDSPFLQQGQQQDQQQPEQQQQQLAFFHSLLGPLHSIRPALPAATAAPPTTAAAGAAAAHPAEDGAAAADAAAAGLLLTVSASEILAAWNAAQAQQQESVATVEAAAVQAAEQPPAQAQPSSWLTSCSGSAGGNSRGSAYEVHAETHRAKRPRAMAAEGPTTDSAVLTAAAAAGAAVELTAAAAWPAAVAAAAAWLSDAAAAAAACGIS